MDDEKRKSFWEEDEDESDESAGLIPKKLITESLDSTEIDQKIHDTKILMDQTHQLYQHYFNGIEKRPPIEKTRLLESKINELQRISASNTASKFKISQFIQLYITFRDLWERKLKAKEKV